MYTATVNIVDAGQRRPGLSDRCDVSQRLKTMKTRTTHKTKPRHICKRKNRLKPSQVAFNSKTLLLQHSSTVLEGSSSNLSGFNKEKITLGHLVFVEA